MSARMPPHSAQWEMRGRWILGALLALGIGGALLLALVLDPPGPKGDAVSLELARDEAGFASAFAEGWREEPATLCGFGARHAPNGSGFGTLRCHLFVDSLLFAPGYVGLLVYFTMVLSRIGPGRRALVVHLLCGPAVAAGLFDIAENGIAILAAEDLMVGLLADATVHDLRLASLCKWALVALSFALLAAITWRAAGTVKAAGAAAWPLQVAAGGAALCAVVLTVGVAGARYALLAPAMLPAMVALALLAWWRYTHFARLADRVTA